MFDIEKLQWQVFNETKDIPEHILPWIINNKSLTAKLKNKYKDFYVNLIQQSQQKPKNCEIQLLKIKNQDTIIREVELMGNNSPVVFARSVIPKTEDTKKLLKIGTRPLGEILFNDNKIQRGQLEISTNTNIFARRSIFTIGNTKILVMEIFLKKLYA